MSFDITSPTNERIRRLVRLKDRKHRDRESVFVVEGERLVGRALEAGLTPLEVYADGSVAVPDVDSVTMVEPTALDRASYRDRSQGLIAVFDQFNVTLSSLAPTPGKLTLAAESIEKPGNLGAMLRTADAVGADAFVAVEGSVDPFNPNVVRASTGALFTVPLAVCDLNTFISWLDVVPLIAATPRASTPYWERDFSGNSAIIVGSEDTGLTPAALSAATAEVAIPMAGLTDSLNASVSMALLAFETLRQRSSR